MCRMFFFHQRLIHLLKIQNKLVQFLWRLKKRERGITHLPLPMAAKWWCGWDSKRWQKVGQTGTLWLPKRAGLSGNMAWRTLAMSRRSWLKQTHALLNLAESSSARVIPKHTSRGKIQHSVFYLLISCDRQARRTLSQKLTAIDRKLRLPAVFVFDARKLRGRTMNGTHTLASPENFIREKYGGFASLRNFSSHRKVLQTHTLYSSHLSLAVHVLLCSTFFGECLILVYSVYVFSWYRDHLFSCFFYWLLYNN